MALTDFGVSILDKNKGNRVIVKILDPEMREYVDKNLMYVYSQRTDQPIRITADKPLDVELLADFVRMLQRCADEINGGRTRGSLATPAQISRARQLAGILNKRKDNSIELPDEMETMSLGRVGRLIHDYKTLLIAEKMWDDEKKCEMIKE